MTRRYLLVIVIVGTIGCKNAQLLTDVQPSGTIDSIGQVTVRHSREISYIPVGDTLIYREGLPLQDYRDADSTIVLEGGRLTVRVPRPAAQQIRDATTVQIPVYKENLDRIRGLQQKADSLEKKNQESTARVHKLEPYKVIVWTVAGLFAVVVLFLILVKGGLGWITNLFGGIGSIFSRIFSKRK